MLQLNEGREIWRVNAFTEQPFAGNPAGVVPEMTCSPRITSARSISSSPSISPATIALRLKSIPETSSFNIAFTLSAILKLYLF